MIYIFLHFIFITCVYAVLVMNVELNLKRLAVMKVDAKL